MKKIRFILFIMILILAFGCPVFAETVGTGAPHTTVDTTYTFYHSYVDRASYGYMYFDEYIDTPGHVMLCKDTNLFYILVPKSLSTFSMYFYQDRSAAGMPSNWQTGMSGPTSSFSKYSNDRFQILYISGYYPTTTSRKLTESYNVEYVFDTFSEMTSYCNDNVDSLIDSDGNIIIPEPEAPKEMLPDLTFSVSRKWLPRPTSNFAHYNFHANWDSSEHEIYASNPQNYVVQAYLSPYRLDLSSSDKLYYTQSLLLDEHLSFSMDDAREVIYSKLTESELDGADIKSIHYYVLLRVASADSSSVSNWHFYTIDGNAVVDNGTFVEDDTSFSQDIPPTDDNNTVDDTPLKKDPDGENTTASNDTTSPSYKENYDPYSLFQNMKSAVVSVKSISDMIAMCYQWLPSWLLSLIACSIGLLVVVGFIKIVL